GGQLTVSLAREDGRCALVVSDTGQGIDPAFLPFVFDRFRQAEASASRRHGGLGLGLSIVAHLTAMHGGEVRAESKGPGRGARFTVLLPESPELVVHAAPGAPLPHPSRLLPAR